MITKRQREVLAQINRYVATYGSVEISASAAGYWYMLFYKNDLRKMVMLDGRTCAALQRKGMLEEGLVTQLLEI